MLCSTVILASLLTTTVTLDNQLLNYFNDNITKDGRVLDRESNRDIVSVAATGFGMYSWAIAAEQGYLNSAIASFRIKKAFRTTIQQNPYKNKNWLFHFSTAGGLPVEGSEVSTIDSAIFYAGALRAAQLLQDTKLISEIQSEIDKVDVAWMTKGKYIRHGLKWNNDEPEFIDVVWDEYSEGIIIYRLFNIPFTPKTTKYSLSLFAYYYPLCFFDEPQMVENLRYAIAYQQEKYHGFGLTAGDTERDGYRDFDPNTFSPLVVQTLTVYFKNKKYKIAPNISFPADAGASITNEQCILSKNRLTGWTSREKIGIETGAAYILLWKAKNQKGEISEGK